MKYNEATATLAVEHRAAKPMKQMKKSGKANGNKSTCTHTPMQWKVEMSAIIWLWCHKMSTHLPKMLFTEIIGFVRCIVVCPVHSIHVSLVGGDCFQTEEVSVRYTESERTRIVCVNGAESVRGGERDAEMANEWQPHLYGRRINNRLIMDFRILW